MSSRKPNKMQKFQIDFIIDEFFARLDRTELYKNPKLLGQLRRLFYDILYPTIQQIHHVNSYLRKELYASNQTLKSYQTAIANPERVKYNADLMTQIYELNRVTQEQQQQLLDIGKEKAKWQSLEHEIKGLKSFILGIKFKVKSFENENEGLKSEIKRLKSEIKRRKSEIEGLTSENERLKSKLSKTREVITFYFQDDEQKWVQISGPAINELQKAYQEVQRDNGPRVIIFSIQFNGFDYKYVISKKDSCDIEIKQTNTHTNKTRNIMVEKKTVKITNSSNSVKLSGPKIILHSEAMLKEIQPPHDYKFTQDNFHYNFVHQHYRETGGTEEITSIKLIKNTNADSAYAAKVIKPDGQPEPQIIVYHGTNFSREIASSGPKIGGVDNGVPVANGSVYGNVFYTSVTPRTPEYYADTNDSGIKTIVMCRAIESQAKMCDGSVWWRIFEDTSYLLPMYILEIRS